MSWKRRNPKPVTKFTPVLRMLARDKRERRQQRNRRLRAGTFQNTYSIIR